MSIIYNPWHSHLGDQWATVNLLLHKSWISGKPTTLASNQDLRLLHLQIMELLNSKGHVYLTDEPGTRELEGYDVWATPYWPTHERWEERYEHRTICYQFDGLCSASLTNPPLVDEDILIRWLSVCGFTPVRVGKPMTPAQCVWELSHAIAFVGVDSGMSHIAHSVGVPTFLLEYQLPIVTAHRGKAYVHCQGTEDFLRHKWPTWIDYLRFLEHPDGAAATVPVGRTVREKRAAAGEVWWLA